MTRSAYARCLLDRIAGDEVKYRELVAASDPYSVVVGERLEHLRHEFKRVTGDKTMIYDPSQPLDIATVQEFFRHVSTLRRDGRTTTRRARLYSDRPR